MAAASNGHGDVVKLLVTEGGADTMKVDQEGQTALLVHGLI